MRMISKMNEKLFVRVIEIVIDDYGEDHFIMFHRSLREWLDKKYGISGYVINSDLQSREERYANV
jgi:hypothetical protein